MAPRPPDPTRLAARRTAILAAAATAFAEQGYEGTRATDIARRAGVSSGTVFYHFGDKASVFRALFAADGPRNEALGARARAVPDALTAVLVLVDGLVEDVVQPEAPVFVVELLRRVTLDPELAQVVADADAIARHALVELLERGVADGTFPRSLDPGRTAVLILSMITGLYLSVEPGLDLRPDLRHALTALLTAHDPGGRTDA